MSEIVDETETVKIMLCLYKLTKARARKLREVDGEKKKNTKKWFFAWDNHLIT